MKTKYWVIAAIVLALLFATYKVSKKINFNTAKSVGQAIDSINGVIVFYNGGVDNVTERNVSQDGYNIGLKYQCVEFVKRYYYEYLNHKMPDSYGHAKDFFAPDVRDGEKNKARNLIQYKNPSKEKPQANDIIVFSGTLFNKYGHVAIISNVTEDEIEIIQQNPGPYSKSRVTHKLSLKNELWEIDNKDVLGWLRKID